MPISTLTKGQLQHIPLPGVDCCFEPRSDQSRKQGPPVTSIDFLFRRIPKNAEGRAWAKERLVQESALLQSARLLLNRRKQAEILTELALCYYLVGELARGRSFSEQAILLWEKEREGSMVIECLMCSGHMHQIGGDVPAAIGFFERVAAYPVEVPGFKAEARYNVLLAIGELHQFRGEPGSAADVMKRALEIAQRARLSQQEKQARMALCMSCAMASRWQEALDAGLPVLRASSQRGDDEYEENLRYVVAEAHKELGQYREAAEQQEELLRQARAKRAPRGLMIEVLMKAALAWQLASDRARAAAYFREVMPLADAETSRPLGPAVRLHLGSLLRESGEPQQGLVLLEQAQATAPPELQPMIWHAKAEAHLSLSQYAPALQAFQHALLLAQQQGNTELVAALLARLQGHRDLGEGQAAAAN